MAISAWEHVALVESASEPGVRHEIKRHASGRLGCDCMAYRFARKEAKTCKHITALRFATVQAGRYFGAAASQAGISVSHASETFTVTRRAISFGPVPAAKL